MSLEKDIRGLVYSIQRYCIHDGPGIRTTVFFKGCQLVCPWCANPESQLPETEIACSESKCTGCGYCINVCPNVAITLDEKAQLDREKCDLCGKCVRACIREAWQIYGKYYSVDDIIAEIEKDMPFYRKSGGGVTFSGGEPTLQPDFLFVALKKCKEKDIHSAIESHGAAPFSYYIEIAPYTDLFLIDVKHMDSDKHKEYVGVGNEKILENIRMLAAEHDKKVMLRVPLIPGFNDDLENIEKTGKFAKEIAKSGNLTTVNILPYHAMGKGKYKMLSKEYAMQETKPPTQQAIDEIIGIFKELGLPVEQGG